MKIFASVIPLPRFSGVSHQCRGSFARENLQKWHLIWRLGNRARLPATLIYMTVAPGRHFTRYNHQNSSVFYCCFLVQTRLLYFKQCFKKKAKTKWNMLVVVKCSHCENGLFDKKSVRDYSHSFKVWTRGLNERGEMNCRINTRWMLQIMRNSEIDYE